MNQDAPRIDDGGWQQRLHAILEEEFEVLTGRLNALSVSADEADPQDQHTQAALVQNARRALAEVTQALRRMAEGRYGACEQCGDRIPWERLEVLPHARHCLPCRYAHR